MSEQPHKLETFRGYTVDRRLCEFRKAEYSNRMEFVPFDSPKGRKLLKDMKEVKERGTTAKVHSINL